MLAYASVLKGGPTSGRYPKGSHQGNVVVADESGVNVSGTQKALLAWWGTTTDPKRTGFLLGDGTRIAKRPEISHGQMADGPGKVQHDPNDWQGLSNLYKVLDEGAIRYVPNEGIYLSRTPSATQARIIVDDWKNYFPDKPLRVDYVVPGTEGGFPSFKQFTDRVTPNALRNWVDSQYNAPSDSSPRKVAIDCSYTKALKGGPNSGRYRKGSHLRSSIADAAAHKLKAPDMSYGRNAPSFSGANIEALQWLKDRLNTTTLYHGTSADALESIKKNGLVPHKLPGGDTAAAKEGLVDMGNGRNASVFITPVQSYAAQLANLAHDIRKSDPLLLKIHLPNADHLKADERSSPGEGYRVEQTIPPSWITDYAVGIEGKKPEWHSLKQAADMFYAVILCGGIDATTVLKSTLRSKFDESQHARNDAGTPEGGRFKSMTSASGVVDGDREKYAALKTRWSLVNNDLFGMMDHPDSPAAQAKLDELKGIVKEISTLKADPGGTEGVGLPGGPRDMVIVGAGPGGMSAAIMGGTDGLDTLLIEGSGVPGGQAKYSSRVENYPGFPAGISGIDVTKRMFEQTQKNGADTLMNTSVTGLTYDPKTELKTLTLSNGQTITSRAVVIAGGVQFQTMDFPGSKSSSIIYGDSKKVSEAGKDKTVVIVGGSNGAAQAALSAAQTAKHVVVLSRSAITKGMSDYQVQALHALSEGDHPKISVIEKDEITGLQTDDQGNATALTTKGGKRIDADILGIFVGGGPNTRWLPSDVKLDKGKVVVDHNLETSMPGVFAVGDVRVGSLGRIGASVGEGQIAERNVFEYFARKVPPHTDVIHGGGTFQGSSLHGEL